MSELAFLAYLVSAILLYFGVSYKIKRWKLDTLGQKIPGPRSYPIVGNSLLFASVNSAKGIFLEYFVTKSYVRNFELF